MSKDTIPCKDCIVFALCNSKAHQLDGVYKTRFLIQKLSNRCNLLYVWIYYGAPSYQISESRKEAFCNVFHIKLNDTPDYNLLKHLPKEEESCLSQWMKKETHQ